jgi:poly-D-alanine transfer protein DltD
MGNQAKRIKQKLKDHPEVLPYSDLKNIDLKFDKLVDISQNNAEQEKKKYFENENLDDEKKHVPIKEGILFLN